MLLPVEWQRHQFARTKDMPATSLPCKQGVPGVIFSEGHKGLGAHVKMILEDCCHPMINHDCFTLVSDESLSFVDECYPSCLLTREFRIQFSI